MLRYLLISLLSLLILSDHAFSQQLDRILASSYEYKKIAAGNNHPRIDLQSDHLGDICILLHHRVPANKIRGYFHWSAEEWQAKLELLAKEGLVKKDNQQGYLPTAMVITLDEGRRLRMGDEHIVAKTSQLIIDKLPEIKKRYEAIDGLKPFSFSYSSLFILSNVLLDSGQIGNVERLLLKSERTSRNGMNYYFAIAEREQYSLTEAFGIYGNALRNYGEVAVGIYGNRREGINLHTLTPQHLKDWFGMADSEEPAAYQRRLLAELVTVASRPNSEFLAGYRPGLEKLGLSEKGRLSVPVLRMKDSQALFDIAGLITNDLVELLAGHKEKLKRDYLESTYAQEISFEEYFIWWYHFFYTQVTDILVAKGHITLPPTGVFTYMLCQ